MQITKQFREDEFRKYVKEATDRFLAMHELAWKNSDIKSFAIMLTIDAMEALISSEPFWESLTKLIK